VGRFEADLEISTGHSLVPALGNAWSKAGRITSGIQSLYGCKSVRPNGQLARWQCPMAMCSTCVSFFSFVDDIGAVAWERDEA
jgi:hypothetical protein